MHDWIALLNVIGIIIVSVDLCHQFLGERS